MQGSPTQVQYWHRYATFKMDGERRDSVLNACLYMQFVIGDGESQFN